MNFVNPVVQNTMKYMESHRMKNKKLSETL